MAKEENSRARLRMSFENLIKKVNLWVFVFGSITKANCVLEKTCLSDKHVCNIMGERKVNLNNQSMEKENHLQSCVYEGKQRLRKNFGDELFLDKFCLSGNRMQAKVFAC